MSLSTTMFCTSTLFHMYQFFYNIHLISVHFEFLEVNLGLQL